MKKEFKELTDEEATIVTLHAVNLTFMSRYQTLNEAVNDLWLSKHNKDVKHLIQEILEFCIWFVYCSNRSWVYKPNGDVPDTEWADLIAGLKEYCESLDLTAEKKDRLETDLMQLVMLAVNGNTESRG